MAKSNKTNKITKETKKILKDVKKENTQKEVGKRVEKKIQEKAKRIKNVGSTSKNSKNIIMSISVPRAWKESIMKEAIKRGVTVSFTVEDLMYENCKLQANNTFFEKACSGMVTEKQELCGYIERISNASFFKRLTFLLTGRF